VTRLRVLWFAFLLLAIAGASDAVAAAKQYQLRQDPQAIAVAQAAFAAMGGAQAVARASRAGEGTPGEGGHTARRVERIGGAAQRAR